MTGVNTSNRKIQFILMVIFVFLAVILFFLLDSRESHNRQQHLQITTKKYELAYKTIYSQHKRLAESIHSGMVKRFEIVSLYEELLTADEIQKKRIRKELSSRIMERYKNLRDTVQLRHLQFHLINNESFFRFHLPDRFGDDLTGIRKTVEHVNREHVPIDGFEEGRANNGYRFVFPITAGDNSHLGSMEISFGPEAFTTAMMKQYAVLSNFFVKSTLVETIVFPEVVKKHYEKSYVFPDYYVDKNVLVELKKVCEKELKELFLCKNTAGKIYNNVNNKEAVSFYESSTDTVVTTIPVFNPFADEMGAFFAVRSKSEYFQNEARQIKIIFFLSLFVLGMILLTFYLQYSKRRVLERAMALLQQERNMFMQGPVMTFTWKCSENWPVEQVSQNVLDILGYDAEEFLTGSIVYSSIIHPDDLQQVFDEVEHNSCPEISSFIHEPYRLLNRNGESVWILDSTTLERDSTGEISHYLGYLVDISSSILMEKEILETRDRLELVIDGARLGTWDWNIKTDDVIFNERWAEITGYRMDEIKPHLSSWKKVVHPDDNDEMMRNLTDHLEGRISIYMSEHRLRHKSGKWIWVLDVGKVFERDDEGNPLRAVGIYLDITEQKKTAQQLIAARDAAEAASRAKSAFLSNMSHELRTPLNAILGYTQIFAGDSSLTSEQQSGIKTMHRAGEHLLLLINDILDLSKTEADKMELVPTEFRLPEFFQGVVEIMKGRMVKKGITFLYEPDNTLPAAIVADALRLRQVLLNLLSNGVKFTPHGYCVLRVQSRLLDGNRVLLTIAVEDSGVGIAPDMLEKIFEPFQQAGDRLQYSEGSGLGLAISRKLVHLMGSELQVVSPVNKHPIEDEGPGSQFVFTVEFPVSAYFSESDTKKHIANDAEYDETLVVPPQVFLKKFSRLIQIGDITGVVRQAEELMIRKSGEYLQFSQKIKQMAEEFQLTELEIFLNLYNTD
jgi:PAS domain S-box-containing protein